ncbi:hypothetical protein [Pseudoduganella lutea]|uniref:Uncharacterized protein n=1 Tax=Pseudoduganella lutea TaxID=321985 RepID=A0A4P6KZF6_9BURK|nr:hypothetical protein [Pseudoduganella lutea]QBE64304.1 hypothetical protein EWM63_15985 [Pseudoduganella lutea]
MAIADLGYLDRGFDFRGAGEFSSYFVDLDTDDFSPALRYGLANYQCGTCLQKWYVECAAEETTYAVFAVKECVRHDDPAIS